MVCLEGGSHLSLDVRLLGQGCHLFSALQEPRLAQLYHRISHNYFPNLMLRDSSGLIDPRNVFLLRLPPSEELHISYLILDHPIGAYSGATIRYKNFEICNISRDIT
jgi:hypothetical protein